MTDLNKDIFNNSNTYALLDMLEKCKNVTQSEKWHPEGDVLTHSLQVLFLAFRESNDIDLIFAAMLHDVGKQITNTITGRDYDKCHEYHSGKMIFDYSSVKTVWLVEQHMRVHVYLNGEMRKLSKCKELSGHPWFGELIQLARWDKMGRNPNKKVVYNRTRIIEKLNEKVISRYKKY